MSGITSPYTLASLAGATAIDVEVQATNAAASPGTWSAITTGKTWGATVAPGGWTAASSQVHSVNVAPNGGVQMIAVAAPTAVIGAAFAWSVSSSAVPTTGLTAAAGDGQINGWAQYFTAPATAGTFYLWMLATSGCWRKGRAPSRPAPSLPRQLRCRRLLVAQAPATIGRRPEITNSALPRALNPAP